MSQKQYTCLLAWGNKSDLLLCWNMERPSLPPKPPGRFAAVSFSIPLIFIPSRSSKEGYSEQRMWQVRQESRGCRQRPEAWWDKNVCLAVSYRVRGSRCFDRWMRTGTKGGSQGLPGKASSPSPMWMWSKGHWWKTRWITSTCLSPPPQVVVPLRVHRYLSFSSLVFTLSMTDPQCWWHAAPRGWFCSTVIKNHPQQCRVCTQASVFMHSNGIFPTLGWKNIISGKGRA